VLLHFLQQPFAGRHVAAAEEDRRVLQVLRPAGEDRPVDQPLHLLRLHAAIAEQLVRPRVDGDHAIKRARLSVAVQLDEDLAFVGHEI
jgi:hypothetical protein